MGFINPVSLQGGIHSLDDFHQVLVCSADAGVSNQTLWLQAGRLALDSLFALAQENPKKFLTVQGKVGGQAYTNGSAAFRILNGSAIKDMILPLWKSPTWKDKIAFWNSLTNTSILSQTALGCYSFFSKACPGQGLPFDFLVKEIGSGVAPELCQLLMVFEECSRMNLHISNACYEIKERGLEMPILTSADRVVQVSSFVGSAAMVGKTLAMTTGFQPLAAALTAVSGGCTLIKLGSMYLASRQKRALAAA